MNPELKSRYNNKQRARNLSFRMVGQLFFWTSYRTSARGSDLRPLHAAEPSRGARVRSLHGAASAQAEAVTVRGRRRVHSNTVSRIGSETDCARYNVIVPVSTGADKASSPNGPRTRAQHYPRIRGRLFTESARVYSRYTL